MEGTKLTDEYVKQVIQDWRETARERRNFDVISSSTSLVIQEKSFQNFSDSKTRGRAIFSRGGSELRESSFYHKSFSRGTKSVEIEPNEGSMESDLIRAKDVNLYLHQPVPLNNTIRASLHHPDNVASGTTFSLTRTKETPPNLFLAH